MHRPFIGAHVEAAAARGREGGSGAGVGAGKNWSAGGGGAKAQEGGKDGVKDGGAKDGAKEKDADADAAEAARCFELCNAAATHISSLGACFFSLFSLAFFALWYRLWLTLIV